jgi:hypothetical protein
VVLTAVILAVNVTLVAVAGTMIDAGTVTALVLLPRATLTPPVGAEPDRVTLHESDADPVNDLLAHESPVTVGVTEVPVPLRLTDAAVAVLENVSCPVICFADPGEN